MFYQFFSSERNLQVFPGMPLSGMVEAVDVWEARRNALQSIVDTTSGYAPDVVQLLLRLLALAHCRPVSAAAARLDASPIAVQGQLAVEPTPEIPLAGRPEPVAVHLEEDEEEDRPVAVEEAPRVVWPVAPAASPSSPPCDIARALERLAAVFEVQLPRLVDVMQYNR